MIKVSESITVRASPEQIFDIVADFERYPEIHPQINEIKIVRRTKTAAEVSFTVNIVGPINYALKFNLRHRPELITWKLAGGDSLMKSNTGSWKFVQMEPKLTDLTYTMDVEFSFWVPEGIAGNIIRSNLPEMLKNFKAEAEKS